jgi:hypothetical protein
LQTDRHRSRWRDAREEVEHQPVELVGALHLEHVPMRAARSTPAASMTATRSSRFENSTESVADPAKPRKV